MVDSLTYIKAHCPHFLCAMLSETLMNYITKQKKPRIRKTFISRLAMYTAICFTGAAQQVNADFVHGDDVIVQGSICVGLDCVNGESFNFDTIRLKENNVRIKFQDTSSSASFPSNDWQLSANDSSNGGENYFAIEDIDSNKKPFKVSAGAPDNSIYVKSNGYIGFNTNTPAVTLQVTNGNSPTLRLEQDGTSGFAAQSWDVGGNETNFFVRDVNNASQLPFRIRVGAPNGSIFVDVDGDIGLGTTTPDGLFDLAHPADVNNHAVLVDSFGNFGINIDNGFIPRSLFDIQTSNGSSQFMVQADGKVGIGMGTADTPTGQLEVKSSSTSLFSVLADGKVGIGSATPLNLFEVKSSNTERLSIASDGKTKITSDYLDGDTSSCGGANGTFNLACGRFTPMLQIEETNAATQGRMMFLIKANQPSWFGAEDTTQNKVWYATNASNGYVFVLFDKNSNEIVERMTIENGGNIRANGGSFINGSSKFIKENFAKVDSQGVLDKLAQLEITSWKYKSEADSVSHIGPMSQDFYALFNVGENDEGISSVDANGVSMAAIKALYERVKVLEAKLADYESN